MGVWARPLCTTGPLRLLATLSTGRLLITQVSTWASPPRTDLLHHVSPAPPHPSLARLAACFVKRAALTPLESSHLFLIHGKRASPGWAAPAQLGERPTLQSLPGPAQDWHFGEVSGVYKRREREAARSGGGTKQALPTLNETAPSAAGGGHSAWARGPGLED